MNNPNQDLINIFIDFSKYYKNRIKAKDKDRDRDRDRNRDNDRDKWKSKAYDKIIVALRKITTKITHIKQVSKVDDIGQKSRKKINEYIKTGKITEYEILIKPELEKTKKKDDVLKLFSNIHGIGEVRSLEFYNMGLRTIKDLKDKPNLLNNKQKIGLKYYNDLLKKIPRNTVKIFGLAVHVVLCLEFGYDNFKLIVAGSYRRGVSESGDIDILITTLKFNMTDVLRILNKWNLLVEDLSYNKEKYMGIAKCNCDKTVFRLDIELLKESEWGSGLLYFTGSKHYNIRMRSLAKKKGYRLSEHGLFKINPKNGTVEYRMNKLNDEREYMEFFGMPYSEPKDRY